MLCFNLRDRTVMMLCNKFLVIVSMQRIAMSCTCIMHCINMLFCIFFPLRAQQMYVSTSLIPTLFFAASTQRQITSFASHEQNVRIIWAKFPTQPNNKTQQQKYIFFWWRIFKTLTSKWSLQTPVPKTEWHKTSVCEGTDSNMLIKKDDHSFPFLPYHQPWLPEHWTSKWIWKYLYSSQWPINRNGKCS